MVIFHKLPAYHFTLDDLSVEMLGFSGRLIKESELQPFPSPLWFYFPCGHQFSGDLLGRS